MEKEALFLENAPKALYPPHYILICGDNMYIPCASFHRYRTQLEHEIALLVKSLNSTSEYNPIPPQYNKRISACLALSDPNKAKQL
jgi:hypothetical protein